MKYFIIVFFILSINIYGQEEVFEWQSCFGGTEYDKAGNFENAMVKLQDGYLILTSTRSDDGDIQSGFQGYEDIWLIKTDFHGNLIWEKTYGGSSGDSGNTLVKYSENVFYILGLTSSDDGDIQSGNHGYADHWLLKINGEGEIIWEQTFGGSQNERIGNMQITPEGDVLVLARTSSSDCDQDYYNPDTSSYIWFYKVNSNGELVWSEVYGKNGPNYGQNFLQTADGGYLILGTCRGLDGGCDCDHHNAGDLYYNDIWVFKLNANREIEWQECYGGSNFDNGSSIIEEDDYYTVLASSNSNDGQLDLHHGTSASSDLWFFKIDKQGNLVHSKVLGGSSHDSPDAIFINEQTGGILFWLIPNLIILMFLEIIVDKTTIVGKIYGMWKQIVQVKNYIKNVMAPRVIKSLVGS